jgi:hypothetical protein
MKGNAARLAVRRDVLGAEAADRQVPGHAAGEWSLLLGVAMLGVGVAFDAMSWPLHEVAPAFDDGGITAGVQLRIGRLELAVLAQGDSQHQGHTHGPKGPERPQSSLLPLRLVGHFPRDR